MNRPDRNNGFRRMSWLLATAAIAAGCAAGPDRSPRVTFRDSAGITIADNTAAARAAAGSWALEEPATLRIGVLDGDPANQLFRVAGAARLGDGRIAVLNAGSQEIRFFTAAGEHIVSVGKSGEGPGEFRSPQALFRLASDSLLVWDRELQRTSVFTDDGRFVRSSRVELPVANPFLAGVFADGDVVIGDHRLEVPRTGFETTFARFVRYSPTGAFADSIGSAPWIMTGIVGDPENGMLSGPVFAPRTSVTLRGDRFWIGTAADPSIDVLDRDGTLAGVIRWADEAREVGPDDVARHNEQRYADLPPDMRRQFEALPHSDRFPAYAELAADAGGNLWVKAFPRPGDTGPDRWTIFDADGALVAHIETPRSLRLFEIGPDWLLGVIRDDLDVERVVLYGIRKS